MGFGMLPLPHQVSTSLTKLFIPSNPSIYTAC